MRRLRRLVAMIDAVGISSRVQGAVALLLVVCTLSACATSTAYKPGIVKAGDQAEVHFTCRFKNGELAVSTHKDLPGEDTGPRSSIFIPAREDKPMTFTAGKDPAGLEKKEAKGFEGEIVYQLSHGIVGFSIGEKRTLELKAERPAEDKPGESRIRIARVRTRAKEMKIAPEEYKMLMGKDAEVGQAFIHDPALPGRVESVDEKEVVVRFAAEEGKEVKTPFGKGILHEKPDHYEIVIDARPGTLVRTGGLVGRITAVSDRDIAIDYGHPFGGESLLCEVEVESAKPGAEAVPPTKANAQN